jgi:DNA-binding NtrC family response regulator
MSQMLRALFAFVDPKDPFTPGVVAGEERTGPVLSLLDARPFDRLFLFCTPHTRDNAEATRGEVGGRFPGCAITVRELPVSDPKDYSPLMGLLARSVSGILRQHPRMENFICVSSGTAEMRAAWFLLAATGALPATLLQIGTPADPLFGAAHVQEVSLESHDWRALRDLVMPLEFFASSPERDWGPPEVFIERMPTAPQEPPQGGYPRDEVTHLERYIAPRAPARRPEKPLEAELSSAFPELDAVLQELEIHVGSSLLRVAAEKAATAAPTDLPVLIQGETGTGKELFARLVTRLSLRHARGLVSVNCAAIPKELAESFLFGHRKGAFTGAVQDQEGKFQQADGGTLFLDEIGELTPDAQAKLLRVLQDGQVEPLGAPAPRKVDVRIIAATNRNLAEEVKAGRFREDLYYRLEVVVIGLPALRERRGEIAPLAAVLLRAINRRRLLPRQLSKEALRRLEEHDWPGNVRELANVLQRSVLYARREILRPEDLILSAPPSGPDPLARLPEPEPGFSLEAFLAQAREQLILRALAKSAGNQSAAADLLGVTRQAISKFLKQQSGNPG